MEALKCVEKQKTCSLPTGSSNNCSLAKTLPLWDFLSLSLSLSNYKMGSQWGSAEDPQGTAEKGRDEGMTE